MTIDRRTLLLASIAASGGAAAQPLPAAQDWNTRRETIELWPKGVPGPSAELPVEKVAERSNNLMVYNDRAMEGVARPRMIVFRPSRPTGAAVLITPGGSYARVVIDKEGFELGQWLSARGITAFVLFYRLPAEGWTDPSNTPLADAQRAMRLIRHRAATYAIDPARVCAMGFSAGGHLCADLATRFDAAVYAPSDAADRLSARPDGAAPIYPVVAMFGEAAHEGSRSYLLGANPSPELERRHSVHLNVGPRAPPFFLLHSEDDDVVPVANILLLRGALKAHGVSAQTHIFPDGGHGFGVRYARGKSVENWPELFLAWSRYQGLSQ